jgi:hypothetical protein
MRHFVPQGKQLLFRIKILPTIPHQVYVVAERPLEGPFTFVAKARRAPGKAFHCVTDALRERGSTKH